MANFDRAKHRNLFNGDSTFLFVADVYNPEGGPYTARVFHRYVDLLADSGVDTFLINPNAQVPWYPSKRTPNILTGYRRGDRDFFRGHYPPFDKDWTPEMLEKRLDEDVEFLNRYQDLVDAGVNWIAELSKACRRRGVSPWVTIRMNDMHGANSWEKSYMNCDLQKQAQYRLKGWNINPRDGQARNRQPLDYQHKEVRDHYFTMIAELVEDHDFEGLELDWLRCPFCCDPTATEKQVDMMTAWFSEIRALTHKQSRQLGRPYPLGLRMPIRLDQMRTIGIDVKRLAREGIVDFVGVSNFWQTSWDVPYDQLRAELGERVALYGIVEAAPNWLYALDPKSGRKSYRLLPASAELMRGNAAGKLALGADGIETFNFFCSDSPRRDPGREKGTRTANYPALRGLENLEGLRGKPKQYTFATMPGHFTFPEWEFAEQMPVILEAEWRRSFRLSMCAEPVEANLELVLQLVVMRKEQFPDLGVSFNGSWPTFDARSVDELLFPTDRYTHHLPEHAAFNYHLKSAQVKEGWNEIVVFNGSHKTTTPEERIAGSVCIVSIELAVT